MKINFLLYYNPFANNSATSNRYRGIIEGLVNFGAEINLIFTNGYNSKNEYAEFGKNGKAKGVKYYYTYCYIHEGLWKNRINKYFLSPILNLITIHKTRIILKKDHPDLLWIQFEHDILKTIDKLFPLKHTGFKLIMELNEHPMVSIINSTNKIQIRRQKNDIQRFEKRILSQIDLLILMTLPLKDYFMKTYPGLKAKYFHLPMTVDLKRFQNIKVNNCKTKYILYAGVLNNKKDGIDILIKAFASISKQNPEYYLYLAGSFHPDIYEQKMEIEKLEIGSKVVYKGEISRDDIPALMIDAEILALARPDSLQARNGFPTKLGEYLASGKPVCVTKTGEIQKYLTDNVDAFMAEPGSVDSFADAMNRALANKENAKKVGLNGKRVAETDFNIDIQVKKLIGFLEQNMGGKE